MARLLRKPRILIGAACALAIIGSGAVTASAAVRPDIALAWTSQQAIGGSGTTGNPAVAEFNGELYGVWKGVNLDPSAWSAG
jgi:hypothetical protein